MKITITLIAAMILLASSTPAIQSVIFNPQRPAAVHVKVMETSYEKDVADYIENAHKKGWNIKAISQSYAYGSGATSYTIIFEAY